MTDQSTQEQVEGVTEKQVGDLFDRFVDQMGPGLWESQQLRSEVRRGLELVRIAWPAIQEHRESLKQVAKLVRPDDIASLSEHLKNLRLEVKDKYVRERLTWAGVLRSSARDDNLFTELWIEEQRVAGVLDSLADAISKAEQLVSDAAGVRLLNDGGRRDELRQTTSLLLDTWWRMIGEPGRGWPPRGVAGGKKRAVEFVHEALFAAGINVSLGTIKELARTEDFR